MDGQADAVMFRIEKTIGHKILFPYLAHTCSRYNEKEDDVDGD